MHSKAMFASLAFFCALIFFGTPAAIAASAAERQLQAYTNEQQSLRERQSQLRRELNELQEAIRKAETSDSPEKRQYEDARAQFLAASETHDADPSSQNEARLRNAEFRLHLAERRYQQSNGDLAELEKRYDNAEAQLGDTRDRILQLNSLITQQEARVVSERERNARLAQQRQEEAQRERERERAQQEQERLQAMSARNQNTSAAAATPAAAPRQTAQADQQQDKRDAPLQLDDNLFLLATPQLVAQEKARIDEMLGPRPSRINTNRILNIRHVVNGEERGSASHRFTGLGNYQYRTQANIQGGDIRLRIGADRWSIRMPEDMGNQEFVILLDELDRRNTRIILYPLSMD